MKFTSIHLTNYIGIYNGMGLYDIKIDMTQCRNRITIIRGDNGSGKSTLAKAMSVFPDPNDSFIPGMPARKEIILESNPTLVISIHMNKFSSANRSGGQVFFKENDEKSKLLASLIQTNLNLISISKRDFSPLQGDYYILNCSNIPSVICECGFLSNREEEMLLITDEYQQKLAQSIFDAVIKYLSLI